MRERFFLVLGSAAILVAGCASGSKPVPEVPPRLVWPGEPNPAKYVYEGDLRNSRSISPETDVGRMRRMLTGAEAEVRGFRKPLGVAARAGRVYVTDTEERRVHVFDIPRRRFFSFGYRLEGELKKPAGVCVDAHGNVYVADVGARRIVMYDALGLFIRAFGGPKELQRPSAVATSASGERIYIVDTGGVESDKHEVVVYDKAGRRLFAIGGRGSEPGRFNLPTDAAVAPDGTLYVLDAGNFRVQAFDPEGVYMRSFGAVGSVPGQFSRPRGIGVDPDGNVYVSDAWFGNVQVFDREGRLLLAIGSWGASDAPGRYRLPAGVALDETHRLYVVDQYFHKIEVIRRLGSGESVRG